MALTAAQTMALHQALEVPIVSRIARILPQEGPGISAFVEEEQNAAAQACALLQARLAELSEEEEALLADLLNKWIEIGTDSTRLDAASAGGISGLSYDPERERDEIRRRIQVIVPLFRAQDEIIRRRAANPTIPVLR